MTEYYIDQIMNSPNGSFIAFPLLRIDHVHLRVSNLKKLVDPDRIKIQFLYR